MGEGPDEKHEQIDGEVFAMVGLHDARGTDVIGLASRSSFRDGAQYLGSTMIWGRAGLPFPVSGRKPDACNESVELGHPMRFIECLGEFRDEAADTIEVDRWAMKE